MSTHATAESSTVEPSTVEPSTVEPSTVEPSTVEPSTVEPSTVEPSAFGPSTIEHSARRTELISRARAKYNPERVEQFASCLLWTDPVVDRLVESMTIRGDRAEGRAGWGEFYAALAGEIEVERLSPQLRELFARAEPPAWVDFERVERGAAVWWRAGVLMLPSLLHVLMEQYSFADLNKPLTMNGRFLEGSGQRLEETLRWVVAVTEPGGMAPGSPAIYETLRISVVHGAIRHHIRASGRWNGQLLGPPINGTGMSHTVLAFAIEPVRTMRDCGMTVTPAEEADVLHLWRWISHLMGVPAELMPAEPADAIEGYHIALDLMLDPDEDAAALVNASCADLIRIDRALPARLARTLGPGLRALASRAVIASSVRWMHPRVIDVPGLPTTSAWRHLPMLMRPLLWIGDAARKRGWRGTDLAIARHRRGTYLTALTRIRGAEHSVSINQLRH